MAGAVHRATFPAILIPSSANNLFHVQPPWGARWNRRVWARRNYEYKSANDGGGGWVENGATTRMGWAASEGDGNGGLKAAGRGMKMTPGIRRLPSFNFN